MVEIRGFHTGVHVSNFCSLSFQFPLVYLKNQNENVESKLHIKSLSIEKKLNVRRLNIEADLKTNIKQLLNGIDDIKAKLNRLRNSTARHKRSITEQSIDTVNVKRLNIPNKLFESKFYLLLPHNNEHV